MDVSITSGPAFAMGTITIPPGRAVRVEAGAMAMTRGDIGMETSTRGGFMSGLKRSLGGESFFVNDFRSGTGGQVGVAAALPGGRVEVTLDGRQALMVPVRFVDRPPTRRSRSTPSGAAVAGSSPGPD